MKTKALLVSLFVMVCAMHVAAQEEDKDKNMFDHLAVGLTAGTPGIGLDVAAPIGNYVQVRVGFATFPTIKYSTDLDTYVPPGSSTSGYDIPSSVKVEGKTGFTNGKILADVFPFKHSSFHITAGAYFGGSSIVKAYNKEDGALMGITSYNESPDGVLNPIGAKLGDYLLTPDANGNVMAKIKVHGFKPYLGLGFGRGVPRKRVGFMFEMGCQFWGSPTVYSNDEKLDKNKVGNDDGGILKMLSKIKVYPVLNFRLCGRII